MWRSTPCTRSDPNELTITIDYGASENVISEEFAPQLNFRASQGSREGVRYVTANGGTISNRDEKHIHVLTTEGSEWRRLQAHGERTDHEVQPGG